MDAGEAASPPDAFADVASIDAASGDSDVGDSSANDAPATDAPANDAPLDTTSADSSPSDATHEACATCATLGYNCGLAGDGCGNILDCGTCTAPQYCGGSGYGRCGGNGPILDSGPSCDPLTCARLDSNCGLAPDGCGGVLDCGTCTSPLQCGAGGTPFQCGNPDAGACVPLTCSSQGIECGEAADGCGNLVMCGSCTAPETCGGIHPGKCG